MKKIVIGAVAAVLLVLAFGYFFHTPPAELSLPPTPTRIEVRSEDKILGTDPASASIQTYVISNISNLSPLKAVPGKTLKVTDITADGAAGTVTYTDGQKSYSADFTYVIDVDYNIWMVTSFTIRT